MKTFEERFVQTIRATQACTEDLVAGPRLTYGDNIGLMYFYEKLNTATKILQGGRQFERIVSHLPNDLIVKSKNEKY